MINWVKKNWVYVLFLGSVIFFVETHFLKSDTERKIKITAKTIKVDTGGWGYEIYTNDTVFIKQKCIPSIAGFKTFETELAAKKTANLVVQKLLQGKLPTITPEDLKTLGVLQ